MKVKDWIKLLQDFSEDLDIRFLADRESLDSKGKGVAILTTDKSFDIKKEAKHD